MPSERVNLYGQMATTLQSSRLLSYHLDLQMQEMFNMLEVMDGEIKSDDDAEKEWFTIAEIGSF